MNLNFMKGENVYDLIMNKLLRKKWVYQYMLRS